MIRHSVEEFAGVLSDETWNDTCKIANNTLLIRRNNSLRTNPQYVVILCIGIADALMRGRIRKGVT